MFKLHSDPPRGWRSPRWLDRCLLGLIPLMVILYLAGFMINSGPSMGHLGWVYRVSWNTQPTQVGQIVRFATPNQPVWHKYLRSSIKRVAEIRPDGFWLEGDNTEQSQDSRDWDRAVPADHIAGVVTWAWSPKRMVRSWTKEGRLRNWVDFTRDPNSVLWRQDPDHIWAFITGREITIYCWLTPVYGPVRYDQSSIDTGWHNGHLLYAELNRLGIPMRVDWSESGGRKVQYSYLPVIATRNLTDGTSVVTLTPDPALDPTGPLSGGRPWGPVVPSTNRAIANYWRRDFAKPTCITQVEVNWQGCEGVAISYSQDGQTWQLAHLIIEQPPDITQMRTYRPVKPVTARWWEIQLVSNNINPGITHCSLTRVRFCQDLSPPS